MTIPASMTNEILLANRPLLKPWRPGIAQAAQAVNAYNQQGGGLQEKQMAQAVLLEGLEVRANHDHVKLCVCVYIYIYVCVCIHIYLN